MGNKATRLVTLLLAMAFASVSLFGCGSDSDSDSNSGRTTDDGKAYLYATNSTTKIDLVDDVEAGAGNGDYEAIYEWAGGATLDGEFAGDTTYDRVFAITPGAAGWSSVVFASGSARDFSDDFMAGLTGEYNSVHFKFKGNYATVKVGFVVGANVEVELRLTSEYAEDLGDGWYSFSIPLSIFGDLTGVSDFYLITGGTADWYLTDIYFDATVIAGPPYADLGDDGKYYLKSGDGSNQIDLIYNSAYTNISDWGTGGGLTDVVDVTHGNAWEVAPGWGWSFAPVGVIAFSNFDPLFVTNFTTLNFTYKPNSYSYVNVKLPGATPTEELTFDLATYGTQIGSTAWYNVSVPLSAFGTVGSVTEFGLMIYADGAVMDTFQVTDVYFE